MSHHTVAAYQPCKVPLRRATFGNATIVVHEGILPAIKRIEQRWEAMGGNRAYLVRQKDTGAYNCRKTTSGRSWSKHSWGAAVDVNWQTNPYGRKLRTDMPKWFIQLWKDEGFGWGGDWRNVKDAMHFSKFPNEGGDGKLEFGEEAWVPMPTIFRIKDAKPDYVWVGLGGFRSRFHNKAQLVAQGFKYDRIITVEKDSPLAQLPILEPR